MPFAFFLYCAHRYRRCGFGNLVGVSGGRLQNLVASVYRLRFEDSILDGDFRKIFPMIEGVPWGFDCAPLRTVAATVGDGGVGGLGNDGGDGAGNGNNNDGNVNNGGGGGGGDDGAHFNGIGNGIGGDNDDVNNNEDAGDNADVNDNAGGNDANDGANDNDDVAANHDYYNNHIHNNNQDDNHINNHNVGQPRHGEDGTAAAAAAAAVAETAAAELAAAELAAAAAVAAAEAAVAAGEEQEEEVGDFYIKGLRRPEALEAGSGRMTDKRPRASQDAARQVCTRQDIKFL